MSDSGTLHAERKPFQWRISTWLVLVAILGWALAVRPPTLEKTTTSTMPNGARHVHVEISPNPHYLGPFIALSIFVVAKNVARWRVNKRRSLR